jgi:hypothetical protein
MAELERAEIRIGGGSHIPFAYRSSGHASVAVAYTQFSLSISFCVCKLLVLSFFLIG